MDKAEEGTEPRAQRAETALIPQTTVWLMAITVGVIVANIYYVQPLLADIAHTFGLSVTRVGSLAMLSQAGTALGMFLFVPLGDKYERRSLICGVGVVPLEHGVRQPERSLGVVTVFEYLADRIPQPYATLKEKRK